MTIRALLPAAFGLILCLTALPVSADEVPVSEEAKEHFKTGVAYLTDPDGAQYEEAYREFKAAYAASPSWKILGNLGISAMKLERDGEAIWAFEKYLAEGGDAIDPAERAQMERDLRVTSAGVVYVTIESTPPGAHFIDERIPLSGRPIVNRYDSAGDPLKLGIRRGRHRITAKLQGHEDALWEFDAEPGQALSYNFEMKPPVSTPAAGGVPTPAGAGPVDPGPQMERPIPLSVYIAGGATGAFLIGGIVTGVLASGKHTDFEDANDGTDPAAAQDLKDSGQTLNLVADILYAGAVVGGATTAVLYFLRPEVPVAGDTALSVNPRFGRAGGGLSFSGSF